MQVQAQYLDTVCTGDVGVMYGVIPDESNSFIQWNLTGGTIVANYGDTIVVDWGDTGGDFTISVQEISTSGCLGDVEYADIMVVPQPDIDLADASICEGETYEIDAGGGFASYLWQDGSTNRRLYADLGGTYRVEVTDDYGCSEIDSMLLTLNPLPVVDLGPDTALCEIFTLNGGTDGLFYTWFDGNNNEIGYDSLLTIDPGAATYSIEVVDAHGCIAYDTINIIVCGGETLVRIPTIITPNDDGYNDVWEIRGLEQYPNAVISVYSRWGTKVYESSGYNNDWNGTFDGKDLPMDSYYYVIDLNDEDGNKYVGTITIVR